MLPFIFVLNPPHVTAQVLTSGADFLKIDSGARSEGMGGAFTAVADDVNAITYNPAGLALLNNPEVGGLYSLYLADIAYSFGGAAMPLPAGEDNFGIGVGFINLGTPSFDSTLGAAPAVSAGDDAFLLSLAYRVKDVVSFGITGKYILRNIAGYTANAYGGDAGLLLTPGDRFRVGAGIFNVGSQVQFISASDSLPMMARLGLAYKLLEIPHHSLLLSVDNGWQFGSSSWFGAAGAEYWYDKTLALRVGYTGDAYQQHLTAGAGINLKVAELDYAYAPMGTLGDTHRFSLIVRFGTEGASAVATALFAPGGFSARPFENGAALSWQKPSSAVISGYNVYVKKPGAANFALLTPHPLVLAETSVKLKNLRNGLAYSFAISSVSTAGRESSLTKLTVVPGTGKAVVSPASPTSAPAPVQAPTSPIKPNIPAPTGLNANLQDQQIELTWDKEPYPQVVGYYIYLEDDQGHAAKISPALDPETHIHLKHPNPNRVYRFMVAAASQAGGESPTSNPLAVSVSQLQKAQGISPAPAAGTSPPPPPAGPPVPAHLAYQIRDDNAYLSWDMAPGPAKYNIYISHDGTSFRLLTKDGIQDNKATLGPLRPGKTYIFGVTSLSPSGTESEKAVQALPVQ